MSTATTGRAWGLAHHFESFEQQRDASYLGMWLFLAQEILFFGGLFTAYLVYRLYHQGAFAAASHTLDIKLGAFNTAVLIGSSLTMALAVRGAQLGRRKTLVLFLLATILLGGIFLGVKVIEYSHKFHERHVPGPNFVWEEEGIWEEEGVWEAGGDAAGAQMYFNLYFAMTGLHALHMIVGIGILVPMVVLAWRGAWTPENHNFVEGMGLYWHFVDIVWIFLFPLLYLLGRH